MALLKGGTYVDGNLIVEGTLYLADLMRLDNDQYVYSNKGNTVQNRLLKYSGSASVEADNSLIYSNDDSLYVTTGLNPDSSSLSASEKAAALAQAALSLTGIEGSTPSLKVSSISTDTLSSKSSKVITVSANHWISTADPYTYSASTVSAPQSSYVATIHSLTNVLKAFQNAGYPISITGTSPAVSCTIGSVEASVPQDGSSALITSNAVYDAISSIRTEAPGSDGSSQYIQDVTQGTSNKLKVVVSKMTADSSPTLNSKKLITSGAVYNDLSTIVTSANADDTSQYIQAVTQGTGASAKKVIVSKMTADSSPVLNSKKLITSGAVYKDLSTIVTSADADDSSQYIQAVTQGTGANVKKVVVKQQAAETEIARQDAKKLITSGAVFHSLEEALSGQIDAINIAADDTPKADSNKFITSKAVYNTVSSIISSEKDTSADADGLYTHAVIQGTDDNTLKIIVKQLAADTGSVAGSKNLITSGAVYNEMRTASGYVTLASSYAANARNSSTSASSSATAAGTHASNALVSESHASDFSSNASSFASQASNYRLLASSFAANSSASASQASSFATNALGSATDASNYATSASSSATQASSFKSLASSYAANSSTSASSASGSASGASTSASEASSYRFLASSYAANSSTSASNALSYATSASAFAVNASSSATNAYSYKNDASSYAANSSTSAANASSYAVAINASLNAGPSKVTVKADTKTTHYLIGVDHYSGSGFLRTREDLYVDESGNLNSLSLTATSARSKKQDIVPTTHVNAVKEINSIDIVDFTYKADSEKNHHVGFIADDTAEVFATKKHDVMDINNCIGMLLKAVQELSYINKKQNEEIAALHDQVDQIDSFLQASVKEV